MPRLGKFKITSKLLRDAIHEDSTADKLLDVFTDILILRSEEDFTTDTVTYVAWSKLFRDIPNGEMIPLYDLTIHEVPPRDHYLSVKEVVSEMDLRTLTDRKPFDHSQPFFDD